MAPAIRASVWVDFGASSSTNFILNDPTGASVLDSSARTLADSNWVDVSASVSGQITTTRGRNRETDQYQAGSCSFTLRNEGRTYDPSSSTSTPLTLRSEVYVAINVDGTYYGIFDGFIDDFDVTYEQPDVSVINVTCVDAFSVLSNVQLQGFTPTAGSPTSQAFLDAMTAANVQLPYSATTGSTKVQANRQDNVTLLDFAQTMARSEQGAVFVDQYGTIEFLGRSVLAQPSGLTFTDDQSAIAADATGQTLGYLTVSQKAATLLLFNSVTGTRNALGAVQQVATDSASRTTYMPRNLDLGTLENQSDGDVLSLCNYVLGKYAQPELRFDAITVELAGLSTVQAQAVLLQAQLARSVPVTRTPGSGSAITRTCVFEGIGWNLDATSGSYRVTYNLGAKDPRTFFILDDATNGVLDTSKLNY